MIQTLIQGLTIGGILYFVSIGLSLTFGTMRVLNFAHVAVYTLGIYFFISIKPLVGDMFPVALVLAMVAMVPFAYVVERYVIRRLYGESVDYTIIATYAVLLIVTNGIKRIWGVQPQPVADPIGKFVDLGDATISVYRLSIVVLAFLVFAGLNLFFRRSVIGKIVTAALDDSEGVRRLGLDVNRYFGIVFILGSLLAVLGGVLYAPMTAVQPYMGFMILLLGFATVIVGGMGNLNGTFYAAIALGLVMAVTGRFWSQAAETMVFIVMGIVLIIKPLDTYSTAGK
ncbi:MAG TPA: branched-chain amino acid ABC transporter permease [Chloroflexota bacterium]|nr:branched-chain amino acid ABC transporter permease [Chloroflexota bacterium]